MFVLVGRVDDGLVSESRESGGQGSPSRPPAAARAKPSGADVFGDVLPEVTGDERAPEPGGLPDSWYEENRPPHHDRD